MIKSILTSVKVKKDINFSKRWSSGNEKLKLIARTDINLFDSLFSFSKMINIYIISYQIFQVIVETKIARVCFEKIQKSLF